MEQQNNNLREVQEALDETTDRIVEEIDERDRQPVRCICCGTTDGLGPLEKLLDSEVKWVCDDCRNQFESIEEQLAESGVTADEIVAELERDE